MTQSQPQDDPVDVGTVDDTDPVELQEVPDEPIDPAPHDCEIEDSDGVTVTEGPDA